MVESSKLNKVYNYLTKNNRRNLKRFAKNEINSIDVAEKCDVSKQLVSQEAIKIDENIFKERKENNRERLEYMRNQLLEGIPLDVILNQTYAKMFMTEATKKNIHRGKDVIVSRMVTHGVIEKRSDMNKHIFVTDKLKNFINIAQIEDEIKYSDEHDLRNKAKIGRDFESSYTKVLNIRNQMQTYGRALPQLPDNQYKALKRNINIAKLSLERESNESIQEKYPDVKDIDLIIESYEPYITLIPEEEY